MAYQYIQTSNSRLVALFCHWRSCFCSESIAFTVVVGLLLAVAWRTVLAFVGPSYNSTITLSHIAKTRLAAVTFAVKHIDVTASSSFAVERKLLIGIWGYLLVSGGCSLLVYV